MKKTIVIVYSNLNIGGIPTKIIDIVNELGKTHPDFAIHILLQKGNVNDQRAFIKNPRVHVLDLSYEFFIERRFVYILWIWWHILQVKPVSILAFVSPYALPVLLLKQLCFWKKLRVIISEDHYTQTMIQTMALPWLQRLGIRLLYPAATAIITPTQAIKQQLVKYFDVPSQHITVIYNWTRFATIPIPKTRRIWDMVHAGRLVPSKNPLLVVRIMEQIVGKRPNIQCAIIGEGSERNSLAAYIKNRRLENNIHLYPPTNNLSSHLLKTKTFLFLPEKQTEGFPLVLLEAMACGAIIISTIFDGLREVIINEKTGIVENNMITLKRLVTQLFAHTKLLERIRQNAKLSIVKNHSIYNINSYSRLLCNTD